MPVGVRAGSNLAGIRSRGNSGSYGIRRWENHEVRGPLHRLEGGGPASRGPALRPVSGTASLDAPRVITTVPPAAWSRDAQNPHEPRRGIPRRRERGCVPPSQRYGIPRFARDDISFEQLRVHHPSHRPRPGVAMLAMTLLARFAGGSVCIRGIGGSARLAIRQGLPTPGPSIESQATESLPPQLLAPPYRTGA